jgi:hypothetical protein
MGENLKLRGTKIEVSFLRVLRKSYKVYTESYKHIINFILVSATLLHKKLKQNFINLVKSLKFTLKYTIISLLHVSVFNDRHQGALSVPN